MFRLTAEQNVQAAVRAVEGKRYREWSLDIVEIFVPGEVPESTAAWTRITPDGGTTCADAAHDRASDDKED